MTHTAFSTSLGRAISHSWAAPGALAVARVLPSGLNATANIAVVPASGAPIWAWVATSHNRAVASWLAVARVLPSGLNATEYTAPGPDGSGAPIWLWVA